MGWFTPYKRRANEFNYTPRFYDPVKEAREQRRAELRGERLDDDTEYTPGKYIRAKRDARVVASSKRSKSDSGSKMKMWAMGVGVMLLAIFMYMLVPRIASIFEMAQSDNAGAKQYQQQMEEYEEFNPYAPLIIVPNDYEEGDEIAIIEE